MRKEIYEPAFKKKKKTLYQQKRALDGHFPNHPSPDSIVPDMDMVLTGFQELLYP